VRWSDLGQVELFQQLLARSATPASGPAAATSGCPGPRCCETTSASVCSGVIDANSWLIWKVRTMPRRTRRCGARRVMSLPSSVMRPSVGVQHAGQQVDQRGLAGAVRADQRMARAARRFSVTLLVAVMPPKRLTSPSQESTVSVVQVPFLRRPNQVHGLSSRSRPTSTSTTRNRPIQKVQYCGVMAR
jgi:hypothetical protein